MDQWETQIFDKQTNEGHEALKEEVLLRTTTNKSGLMFGDILLVLPQGVNRRLWWSAQQVNFSLVQNVGYIAQQAPTEVLQEIRFRQLNTFFID
jgi:hypothetical protein